MRESTMVQLGPNVEVKIEVHHPLMYIWISSESPIKIKLAEFVHLFPIDLEQVFLVVGVFGPPFG